MAAVTSASPKAAVMASMLMLVVSMRMEVKDGLHYEGRSNEAGCCLSKSR